MLQLLGDYFEAKFVVATTDYDSGGGSSVSASGSRSATGSGAARGAGAGSSASGRGPSAAPVKREKSESLPSARAPHDGGAARAGGGAHRPLFNPPTPSPAPAARPAAEMPDDDDEYGGGMDADALGFDDVDALFAEVDQVSQVHLMASQSQREREPSEAAHGPAVLVSDSTAAGGADENDAEAAWTRTTQLGPTQGGVRATSAAGAGGGPSGGDEREREAKRVRARLDFCLFSPPRHGERRADFLLVEHVRRLAGT